jgi:hypothetical protein
VRAAQRAIGLGAQMPQLGEGLMRYVGIAWIVVRGLIELAVVAALLHATHSAFETMVMGALVVIYAAIVGTFKGLGRSLLHVSHKQLEFFITIGTLLKHPDLEIYSAALKEEDEETQKAQTSFTISVVFNWLVGLIGTLALLLTALRS